MTNKEGGGVGGGGAPCEAQENHSIEAKCRALGILCVQHRVYSVVFSRYPLVCACGHPNRWR